MGKRAARAIDAWLKGVTATEEKPVGSASFDRLNPWYYADAPQKIRPQLDIVRRQRRLRKFCRD